MELKKHKVPSPPCDHCRPAANRIANPKKHREKKHNAPIHFCDLGGLKANMLKDLKKHKVVQHKVVSTYRRTQVIPQCDEADTGSETEDETDDEVDFQPVRPVLILSAEQGPQGAPLRLEVNLTSQAQAPSCAPLCVISNPCSAWNKLHNIRTFLQQVSPDVMILSEHWGRKKSFGEKLEMEHFKAVESSRGKKKAVPTRGRNGTMHSGVERKFGPI